MIDAHADNLVHVLLNNCKDPDCEIHNPEVGIAEGTVTPTDLAFFYAGAMTMRGLIAGFMEDSNHDGEILDLSDLDAATAELRDQLNLNGA